MIIEQRMADTAIIQTHFCLDDSPWFRMIELDSTDSTNQFLQNYQDNPERRITLVSAEYQTAGRGSGTNTWESAQGQNLLFSLLTHPRWQPPTQMYALSEVAALAVCRALDDFVPGFQVKWPNDIYYADTKVVGMLIENKLRGNQIDRCIIGIGLNVNQTRFLSDAPNPCSLALIMGHSVERRFVLERVMEHFTHLYGRLEHGRAEDIHAAYLDKLYRKGEMHTYRDAEGAFRATLTDVLPDGHAVLVDEEGRTRTYAFKEVSYIINNKTT